MLVNRFVIVGPQPPAIGGIATIISILRKAFSADDRFAYVDTSKSDSKGSKLLRPALLCFNLIRACVIVRPKSVLVFSSAFASFWEKLAWTRLVLIFGGKPCIVMVDGNFPDYYQKLSPWKKKLAARLIEPATIVGQSPLWANYYKSIFPRNRIEQISGGVDTEFFRPVKRSLDDQPETLTLLFVGWVVASKGVYDLLHALAILNCAKKITNPRVVLKIVGPLYDGYEEIRQIIDEHSVHQFVDIVGAITSREELREHYGSADIFVFPSHVEGFPVALLEAISMGLPCLATEVGGIPDILGSGDHGLIVPPRNPEALAQALAKLICDYKLRRVLGEKARRFAENHYSLSSCADSYIKILEGVANDCTGSSVRRGIYRPEPH